MTRVEELLAHAAEIAREQERRRELREVRRLTAEARETDPAARASRLVAEEQNEQHGEHADAVERRRGAHQQLVVDRGADGERAEAEDHPNELAWQKVEIELRGRAREHQRADAREQERAHEQSPRSPVQRAERPRRVSQRFERRERGRRRSTSHRAL